MDIDPANDCLKYICDRFELTIEQRYWIAFLYSTCYCAPTVFYIYNEFPDFENVDVNRMERWWSKNKAKLYFQTDRSKIRTMNKFVETYESYKKLIGSLTQHNFFNKLTGASLHENYNNAYNTLSNIRNVGRFTLFIYLEMISVLTDFKCEPDKLEWQHADNCRNGLQYHLLDYEDKTPYNVLDSELQRILIYLENNNCTHKNIFNVETTLCAFKKFKHGKRYPGFYLDRQLKEIEKMESNVRDGVCWRVLYEFRKETYKHLNHGANLFDCGSVRHR